MRDAARFELRAADAGVEGFVRLLCPKFDLSACGPVAGAEFGIQSACLAPLIDCKSLAQKSVVDFIEGVTSMPGHGRTEEQ